MKNFYEILGVERDAHLSVIKKAYKEGCLKFHPDKNLKSEANEQFYHLKIAYHTLSDAHLRALYDDELKTTPTINEEGEPYLQIEGNEIFKAFEIQSRFTAKGALFVFQKLKEIQKMLGITNEKVHFKEGVPCSLPHCINFHHPIIRIISPHFLPFEGAILLFCPIHFSIHLCDSECTTENEYCALYALWRAQQYHRDFQSRLFQSKPNDAPFPSPSPHSATSDIPTHINNINNNQNNINYNKNNNQRNDDSDDTKGRECGGDSKKDVNEGDEDNKVDNQNNTKNDHLQNNNNATKSDHNESKINDSEDEANTSGVIEINDQSANNNNNNNRVNNNINNKKNKNNIAKNQQKYHDGFKEYYNTEGKCTYQTCKSKRLVDRQANPAADSFIRIEGDIWVCRYHPIPHICTIFQCDRLQRTGSGDFICWATAKEYQGMVHDVASDLNVNLSTRKRMFVYNNDKGERVEYVVDVPWGMECGEAIPEIENSKISILAKRLITMNRSDEVKGMKKKRKRSLEVYDGVEGEMYHQYVGILDKKTKLEDIGDYDTTLHGRIGDMGDHDVAEEENEDEDEVASEYHKSLVELATERDVKYLNHTQSLRILNDDQ